VCAVRFGRADGDVELLGDLVIRMAECEQPKNLVLAFGEGIGLGRRALLRLGGDHSRAERGMHVVPTCGDLAHGRHDRACADQWRTTAFELQAAPATATAAASERQQWVLGRGRAPARDARRRLRARTR